MQYSRLHSQPVRPQRKSKKNRSFARPILAVVLVGLIIGAFAFRSPDSPIEPVPQVEAASVVVPSKYDLTSVAMPPTGQGAIAVSEKSMNIHASGDQVWPMASVTKVITALAILKKAPLELGQPGESFVLNQKDEQYYWDYAAKLGTLTPVTAGYEMTQYEILQTMLLASSNNMTDSLVDRYFATHDEFTAYANDMLRSYGLAHTKLADATGYSPDSVSTPTEMIKIGQIALANPVIAEIVRQPNASPRVAGWIPNYNALINQPGVTGIKPGLTDQSGHNLLFSFETPNKDGETVTVIGVVMGMFNRSEYIQALNSMMESAKAAVASQ